MRLLLFAVAFVLPVFGQSTPLKFEVASIKRSNLTAPPSKGVTDASRIEWRRMSLQILVRRAYSVENYQIVGPEWLLTERYDIAATLPAGAGQAQIPEMLQTLLAERFRLQLHHEQRDTAVYALIIAKDGPKMKRTEGDPHPNQAEGGVSGGVQQHHMAGSATIDNLTGMLMPWADRPIVNLTRIEGMFDYKLDFVTQFSGAVPPAGIPVASDPGGGTLYDAVSEQLGLKLDPRRMPMDHLMIDHAEPNPTGN